MDIPRHMNSSASKSPQVGLSQEHDIHSPMKDDSFQWGYEVSWEESGPLLSCGMSRLVEIPQSIKIKAFLDRWHVNLKRTICLPLLEPHVHRDNSSNAVGFSNFRLVEEDISLIFDVRSELADVCFKLEQIECNQRIIMDMYSHLLHQR